MKRIILSILYTVAFSIVYAQETMEWETLHDITVNSTPEGYVFEAVKPYHSTHRESSFAKTAYKTGEVASIEFKVDRGDVLGASFYYKKEDSYEKAFYIYKRRQYYFIGTPYGKEVHTQTGIKSLNDGDILKISKDYNNIYFHHNGEVLKTIEIADIHKGKEFYGNISIIDYWNDQDRKVENVVFKGFVEPEKEPFEVKVVDPFYRFDTEQQNFEDIVKGLIDKNGNACTDCSTKGVTTEKIKNGDYFYHIGINGDRSYFDNVDFENFDKKALDEELVMLGSLLINNTNEKQTYQITTILPGNDIIVRREVPLDTNLSGTGDHNPNLRFVGDPLTRLLKDESVENTWNIDLYPNEIVKLFVEFKSDYRKYNSNNDYKLTVTNNDFTKDIKFNLEIINRIIPKTNQTSSVTSTTFFENFNTDFGITHQQLNQDYMPSYKGKGLIFDNQGNLVETNDNSMNSLMDFLINRNNDETLDFYVYYSADSNHFTTFDGNLIQANNSVYSEEWANAFINTLIYMQDYLLKNNISTDRLIIFPFDETTKIPRVQETGEIDYDFINNLYTRVLQETTFKILQSFGNNWKEYNVNKTKEIVSKLDYIKISDPEGFSIIYKDSYKENVSLDFYINNFSRNSKIELARTTPLLYTMRGYNEVSFFPSIGSTGQWNGKQTRKNSDGSPIDPNNPPKDEIQSHFYRSNCGNLGQNKIIQYWNPSSIGLCPPADNGWYKVDINHVPSIRIYAQLQSNIDRNIYAYLKDLNNPIINNELEILTNTLISQPNFRVTHQISNQLKELYKTNSINPYENATVAIEDAYVMFLNGTSFEYKAFGSTSDKYYKSLKNTWYLSGSSQIRQNIYLKFDIKDLMINDNEIVELVLTSKKDSSAKIPAPFDLFEGPSNWSEETITYRNQPGNDCLSDTGHPIIDKCKNAGVISIISGINLASSPEKHHAIRYNITDYIKNNKEKNINNVTIIIGNQDQNRRNNVEILEFYSKEFYNKEYRPRLEVVKSTQSSSRKVVESKEIPTFEEPISFTVVYPNPTEGLVNVNAEKDIRGWKIVSLSGKVIGHNQFNAPKRRFSTNISNQAEGLYMIQIVYTDGTTESKKIMKK